MQIAITPDATIFISVAQMEKPNHYYKEIITQGLPHGNDGKEIPNLLFVTPNPTPKGAKNVDPAKALLRDFSPPDKI